jgi:AcrR family transcriptional regulator
MDIRDRILEAAARVYAETGFRGTTTRRVATEAGVNEITLFRHFGTKEALVKAALRQVHCEAEGVLLGEPHDPEQELYAWAITTFHQWHEGRHMLCRVMGDLVEHPEIAPEICERPREEHARVSRYLERMRELGLATGDFVADAAAGLLMGAIFTHAVWRDYFADPDLPPVEQVIHQYVSLVLRSIGAAAGDSGAREIA